MCYDGIGGEETDRGRKVGGQVGMVGRKWHGGSKFNKERNGGG